MMSAKAVVCPFCGARQASRDILEEPTSRPTKARQHPRLSPAEAASLTAPPGRAIAPDGRGLESLLLPRHDASPFARTLEIIFTILGLPLVALGILPLFIRFRGFGLLRQGSEGLLTFLAVALGGLSTYALGMGSGLGSGGSAALVGFGIGALGARYLVRRAVA